MDVTYEEIVGRWSRRVGGSRTWIVPGGTEHLDHAFPPNIALVESLGGVPVACPDIKSIASDLAREGRYLAVDNTMASSFGCAAVRLGAVVAIESLDAVLGWQGSGLIAVTAAAEVPESLRDLVVSLEERPKLSVRMLQELVPALESFDERRRGACDNAQVAAAYLACHPKVARVRYPGLKGDPSQPVAGRTLQSGFGPCIDMQLLEARPDLDGRILCAPGNAWVPGGIASRLGYERSAQGTWLRLTCGYGAPDALIEALETTL